MRRGEVAHLCIIEVPLGGDGGDKSQGGEKRRGEGSHDELLDHLGDLGDGMGWDGIDYDLAVAV